MNRREFLASGAVVAGAVAASRNGMASVAAAAADTREPNLNLNRHRFGVNYTPSHNWYFCWNDWNPDPIRRDLDAVAALGADHIRIMLVWPFFQPNPKWVSPAHLDRLDQLITIAGERHLDVLVTAFTGQLSGWFFLPPFNRLSDGFYTDPLVQDAQEVYIRAVAQTLKPHANVIGFDFGNELTTCWQGPIPAGDAWMKKMFALMYEVLPDRLHVNGLDHRPWFTNDTFSQEALAAAQFPVTHCYPYWSEAVKYGGPFDPPSVRIMAGMTALIRAYAGSTEKPVWVGEFNTCIKELPEKQQAAWLEKSVLAGIDEGVNWFTYWDSHDVDRKFDFNPLEYTLGLLTNDGKVKEQGRVFKQLVAAYAGKPVVYPKKTLPPPLPLAERTQDGTWKWVLDWMGWKPAST
ncbi:MAG TPA: cellulase family glycosylhydrolase [Terracidiphilus sp.]|nr:cellulase family glycosylhydrolase [Terracidiphilus sp.]